LFTLPFIDASPLPWAEPLAFSECVCLLKDAGAASAVVAGLLALALPPLGHKEVVYVQEDGSLIVRGEPLKCVGKPLSMTC
jgi:hypothetical protein